MAGFCGHGVLNFLQIGSCRHALTMSAHSYWIAVTAWLYCIVWSHISVCHPVLCPVDDPVFTNVFSMREPVHSISSGLLWNATTLRYSKATTKMLVLVDSTTGKPPAEQHHTNLSPPSTSPVKAPSIYPSPPPAPLGTASIPQSPPPSKVRTFPVNRVCKNKGNREVVRTWSPNREFVRTWFLKLIPNLEIVRTWFLIPNRELDS